MTISVGDRLPEAVFHALGGEGPEAVNSGDFFSGKKVALFAVPGAFTPTCHIKHLPGFVDNAAALKAKGVDAIACTAVNDVFVMSAWADAANVGDAVEMLADGNGEFARTIGMDIDLTGAGLGLRSRRYAMLVDDGVVKVLNVEEDASQAETSSAETLLKSL